MGIPETGKRRERTDPSRAASGRMRVKPDESRRRSTRKLATVAMIGAILYILVDVVLQLLPPHYSVVSEAESNLAVGPYGWIMNLNFLARGAVTVCAVAALARFGPRTPVKRAGLALMLLGGAASVGLAFLPTDIPATDAPGLEPTTALGAAHLMVATVGFVAALTGFALLTVWFRGGVELRAAYPVALVFTSIGVVGLVALGVSATAAPGVIGLAERLCLAGVLGWVIGVCAVVRRR
jgi:hypothetical membrane protein